MDNKIKKIEKESVKYTQNSIKNKQNRKIMIQRIQRSKDYNILKPV